MARRKTLWERIKENIGSVKLRSIEMEFSIFIASIKFLFKKDNIPKSKVKRSVKKEIARLKKRGEIPGDIIPDTIAMIAKKERMKAMKKGKYEDAIALGLVEAFALESKKPRP